MTKQGGKSAGQKAKEYKCFSCWRGFPHPQSVRAHYREFPLHAPPNSATRRNYENLKTKHENQNPEPVTRVEVGQVAPDFPNFCPNCGFQLRGAVQRIEQRLRSMNPRQIESVEKLLEKISQSGAWKDLEH